MYTSGIDLVACNSGHSKLSAKAIVAHILVPNDALKDANVNLSQLKWLESLKSVVTHQE